MPVIENKWMHVGTIDDAIKRITPAAHRWHHEEHYLKSKDMLGAAPEDFKDCDHITCHNYRDLLDRLNMLRKVLRG